VARRNGHVFVTGNSGFPKSHDISKAIDKAAGAEREVIGMHPNPNASGWITAGKANEGHETIITSPSTSAAQEWDGWGTALKPAYEPVLLCAKPLTVEHLFGIMVEDITNTLQEVLQCSGLSARDVDKSFSGIRVRLEKARVYTVHENARINIWENTASVRYVASSFTFSERESSEPTRTRENSALSRVKPNGSQSTTGERPIPAGGADGILTKVQDISMSVITGDISENTASLWSSISDALLTQVNTFTIETGIKLTTALRTFKSFLTQTISDDTGNLSPEYRPIILAMKPLPGTFASNALTYGVAGLWVDGCRVVASEGDRFGGGGLNSSHQGFMAESQRTYQKGMGFRDDTHKGRWPANLVLSHTPECRRVGVRRVKGEGGRDIVAKGDASWFGSDKGHWTKYHDPDGYETVEKWECAPDCPINLLDEQSGERPSGGVAGKRNHNGQTAGEWGFKAINYPKETSRPPDTGGASRFFYTAKASRSEREAGLIGHLPCLKCGGMDTETHIDPKTGREVKCRRNGHPTVKPLELCRWLCRLTKTPTGGVVLDPFMGSGTIPLAAVLEGRDPIGIELERASFEVAQTRIEHVQSEMVQLEMPHA
jgi:hypothetical protein